MIKSKVILVAGPTASGKSALALDLARKAKGVVINADAMQIYSGLPILSAQPALADRNDVPHELYGVLDPGRNSSVGQWLALAHSALQRTMEAGCTPIFVGGTGLYFKALFEGLSSIPPIPDGVRSAVQQRYDEIGEDRFRAALAALDPESARRLAKNDRQRSIRAYEVAWHTGKPIAHWHAQTSRGLLEGFQIEPHLLMPKRAVVYEACDRRFERMIAGGGIDEARDLMERNLPADSPAMKTIGLGEIASYLKGVLTLPEAVAKAQQATRNYAKRQMTWFRNQWPFR